MFMPQRVLRQAARLPALLPCLAALFASWWLVAAVLNMLPGAPTLRVLAQPQPVAAAGAVAQQSWFGVMQDAAASQVAPPVSVLGVLGGGQGSRLDFAILLENGQKIVVRAGDKTPGGWMLLRVNGSGVVLRQPDGRELSVALSRQAVPDGAPPSQAPAQPQQFGAPAVQPAMPAPVPTAPAVVESLHPREASVQKD